MHMFSRCVVVGFLLALAAISSGCQSLQPVASVSAHVSEPDIERGPSSDSVVTDSVVNDSVVTDTVVTDAVVSEIVVSETAVSESVAVVESVNETTAIVSAPLTTTAEISVTVEEVASEESVDPALLAAGLAAYHAQYCGVCHTLDAAETRGTFGPAHNGIGTTAAARIADSSYSGTATTPAEYLRESIVAPQAYSVPGYATTSHRMPSYAHLDDATLNSLVAFLLSQK